MAKRFIDTSIWTQNKWFRKLKPQHKVFWFYLITSCDAVGVWEEDLELASFIIGYQYDKQKILDDFGDRIRLFNNKKWWIIDFCDFQYGTLDEKQVTNKPHQSYINLLKKHSLWIDYTKTIYSLKEKEEETEKEIDKEKEDVKTLFISRWSRPYKNISELQGAEKLILEYGYDKVNDAFRIAGERDKTSIPYVRGILLKEEKDNKPKPRFNSDVMNKFYGGNNGH